MGEIPKGVRMAARKFSPRKKPTTRPPDPPRAPAPKPPPPPPKPTTGDLARAVADFWGGTPGSATFASIAALAREVTPSRDELTLIRASIPNITSGEKAVVCQGLREVLGSLIEES